MMAAATGRSQVTAATEHSPRFVTAATEHSARVQAQSRAAMQPLPKAMPRKRHRSATPPWRQPGQAVQRPRYSELLSWSWPTNAQGQEVVEVTLQVCLTNVAGGVRGGGLTWAG